jgi:serine/threonine protein kinase
MATVYLAEDLKHHRRVAVKVLRAELPATLGPDRFLREIEVATHLQHVGVCCFGDRRDLFEYDLLLDVLAALAGLERVRFIPMLTPDDDSREGQSIALSAGGRRPALAAFLSRCREERRHLEARRARNLSGGTP